MYPGKHAWDFPHQPCPTTKLNAQSQTIKWDMTAPGTFFPFCSFSYHILPLFQQIVHFLRVGALSAALVCFPTQRVLTVTPGGKAVGWVTVMNEWVNVGMNEWGDGRTLINKPRQLGQHFSHEFWVGSYFIQNSDPYPYDFFLITPIFIPCT